MRLLVCSDLHGSKHALDMLERVASEEGFDAVVMCGDFTTYGSVDFVREFLSRFRTRVLAVPGNCDLPDTVEVLEKARASVHNTRTRLHELWFFGFGGGLPSSAEMPFEIGEDIIERSLRSVAVQDGVMVTHTPAYGMNDCARAGKNLGSNAIMRVAAEYQPVLAVSGHVHECPGKVASGPTTYVNPGPAKNGFYAVVTVGDTVQADIRRVVLSSSGRKTY